ncbi:MAG TPA: AAA family ATPase [Albitalea sp.]|nr:AAA family ATPase [Albitalea sp.]
MYALFFGLKQEPFSIAPDPRYLFMSERHREALAHLLYGVNGGGGFVLLSGEIGAGKTTVCRCFLEQIPKRCNVAYIFNPKLTVNELLKTVCDEFGIPYAHQGPGGPTVKDYLDPLNEFLLKMHAVGQNNLLIIDEAQNLSADVLEQLRLLTNLETNERKLLQIILIGQPELRTMLARPELEQLAQRVIARFHLDALSERETVQYIKHRLAVAGLKRALPFDRDAMRRIHKLSRGVPRRINLLCDRALLGAYASEQPTVDRTIIDKAASEVFDMAEQAAHRDTPHPRMAALAAGLVGGAVLAGGAGWWWWNHAPTAATVAASTAAASAPAARAALAGSAVPAAPLSAAARTAASAASAPIAVAAIDLNGAAQSPARNERQAWRQLAPLWKLTLGDDDPCGAAARQQVQCFKSSTSNLALIRQLNRPGIVTLHDDSSKPVYALLTGLSNQSATLRIGDTTQTVTLATLAKLWRGDFATFWRAPPGYQNRLVDSDNGPLADWLSAQLAVLDGDSRTADKPASESALKTKVQAFQLANGLRADGLAGPTTFMQLNRATGVDEPRLFAER